MLIDPTSFGFAPTWWVPWPEMHEMSLIEEVVPAGPAGPAETPKLDAAPDGQPEQPAEGTAPTSQPAETDAVPIPPGATDLPPPPPASAPPLPDSVDEPVLHLPVRGALGPGGPMETTKLGSWSVPLVRFKLNAEMSPRRYRHETQAGGLTIRAQSGSEAIHVASLKPKQANPQFKRDGEKTEAKIPVASRQRVKRREAHESRARRWGLMRNLGEPPQGNATAIPPDRRPRVATTSPLR